MVRQTVAKVPRRAACGEAHGRRTTGYPRHRAARMRRDFCRGLPKDTWHSKIVRSSGALRNRSGPAIPGLPRLPWALLLALAGCVAPEQGAPDRGAAAVRQGVATRLLAEPGAEGYARALTSREFAFPRDHAAHDEYRSEWWYFTGNLRDPGGRHFGFELTFFRYALAPESAPRRSERSGSSGGSGSSEWRTNQAWMAHLAVTDTRSGEFIAAERFSREAPGLAGSRAQPFRVWLEDWSAYGEGAGIPPLRLRASMARAAIDLGLNGSKPIVLQGDNGLDRKGPEPGNASHYYSLTRLDAAGTIRVGDDRFDVTGTAWMDREWGTSALSPDLAGWDWFGLQLADNREIMYYRLRTDTGDTSPFSGGSLVQADGARIALGPQDVTLTPLEYWTSRTTGSRYPIAWRLDLHGQGMTLQVHPYLPGQELNLAVRYWEGAVNVTGAQRGTELTGDGYVELTGY